MITALLTNAVAVAGLLAVATVCASYLGAVAVALFHPSKARRDSAIAVLERIPAPTALHPRRASDVGPSKRVRP
ncbi:hypothetical protein [Nocardia sp. NPDC050710]|uniref:hypothetical protein n=1 Tax=Nocardia sp. NPDC050710 TaxID=3157220 RepID=UPI0033EDBB16